MGSCYGSASTFNRFAGARQFLEQIDKRFIILTSSEVHAKLAGAIATQIGFELVSTNLFRLLSGRRAGEFGMEEASVASEGATSGSCRRHRFVGHSAAIACSFFARLRWLIEQLGWTTADATLCSILSFGSSRSCAQATESKIFSRAWRSRFSGVRCSTISLVIPNEHELASQTIGSLPPSLQRHRLSAMRFAMMALPSR